MTLKWLVHFGWMDGWMMDGWMGVKPNQNFQSSCQQYLQRQQQQAGKSYTGERSGRFEKLEKPVGRPKGRQLNKFGSMLFTKMK